jgi:hypothetical protein
MYSTCTFCHAPLGSNEMLEHFPVGRRLAFDAAKGRLWVICAACKQWNLSPLDERWEAIESAERLFRDTRLRASTDQVGLARLRDGSELIRIGQPLRPEFAAWRYGDRFTVRWKRYTALSVLFGGGAVLVGPLAGLGFSMLPFWGVTWTQRLFEARRVIASVSDPRGAIAITLPSAQLARVEPAPDDPLGWRLSVPHLRRETPVGHFLSDPGEFAPRIAFTGERAIETARRILPHVNREGARRGTVADAVRVLEESGDSARTFARASTTVGRDAMGDPARYLSTLPTALRLALEMAAHEDFERRALEGELASLVASWKAAEEVAAIADSLTLPEWMADRLDRFRRG